MLFCSKGASDFCIILDHCKKKLESLGIKSYLFELLHKSVNVKNEISPPIPLSLIQLYSKSTLTAAQKFGTSPPGEMEVLTANHDDGEPPKNDEKCKRKGLPKRKDEDRPDHGTSLDLFGDGYPGLM